MASEVDIANRALSRLGALRITALADDTKNGRAANSAWTMVRDEVLRAHPWNAATKRKSVATLTGTVTGATQANPCVITATAHPFSNGDVVIFSGVGGMTQLNGGRYIVASAAANSFALTDLEGANVNSTAYGAYTSGGIAQESTVWGPALIYRWPSDCLRVLEVEGQGDDAWLCEGQRILTDLKSPLRIRYIWQNTTTTTWEPLLVSAMAARLEVELAWEVTDSPTKARDAQALYDFILSEARANDAREQTPTAPMMGAWEKARL